MRYSGAAMRPLALLASTLLLGSSAIAQPADGTRCTNPEHPQLEPAHVLSAEIVPAGTFVAPPRPTGKAEQVSLYKKIPAFCRVKIQATPSADSNIQIEVW